MFQKIKTFLLENQTFHQTIFKNTFWLGSGQIVGRLIRAIFIIYAARALGTASYGAFSYGLTLTALFTIFSDIGVGGILTREAAKNPELKLQYFSTAFFIKIFLLIFSFFLIITIAPFFITIKETLPLIPIMALLLVADSLTNFAVSFFRALEKMQLEAGVFIFQNIAIVGLSLMILFKSPTSFNLAVIYTASSFLGTLATFWLLRKEYGSVFKFFNKNLIYPIISSAIPFALIGILSGLMINTDTIMIGWLKSAGDVGLYAAAQRPILLLYVIPGIITTALFPTFSRLTNKKNSEKMRGILEKALVFSLLLAIPITLGGIILGPELITAVFGQQYIKAIPSFQLLLITLLIIFPGTLMGNAIFAYNRQKIFFISIALGAIGNVILNALLIPSYGIEGAAIATTGAQILTNSFQWREMKKINYFQILPKIFKIIIAGFLMAALAFVFKIIGVHFAINIILSAAFYFMALIWLKEKLIFQIKELFKN